jgi:hypothetical protein
MSKLPSNLIAKLSILRHSRDEAIASEGSVYREGRRESILFPMRAALA